jgi:16S rRNA (cytosine1402-N4)-methyltransferase
VVKARGASKSARQGRLERSGPARTTAPAPLTLDEARAKLGGETEPGPASGALDLWSQAFGHQAILAKESLEALNVKPDGFYVDVTAGGLGHGRMLLASLGPEGKLLALDLDPEAIAWAEAWARGDPRLIARQANFRDLPKVLEELGLGKADGIMCDLGISSRQLSCSGRGFSFLSEGEPLDMRLCPEGQRTAEGLVNSYSEEELARIIYRYGEERASRRLARAIVREREREPIRTVGRLAKIAEKALWRPGFQRIHPATRLFMALRIEANRELENLSAFLEEAPLALKPGGRLAVISFHSLEDRLVKEAFRPKSLEGGLKAPWRPLWKKPRRPGPEELAANRRSRSAKLRAAELNADS